MLNNTFKMTYYEWYFKNSDRSSVEINCFNKIICVFVSENTVFNKWNILS